MVNNSTNNNKENNHLSLKLTEHTQGNDKWHWKFKSWLGTGTKMYDFFLHWTGCKLTYDIGNSSPGLEQAQKCVIFPIVLNSIHSVITLIIIISILLRSKLNIFFTLFFLMLHISFYIDRDTHITFYGVIKRYTCNNKCININVLNFSKDHYM